MRRVVFLKRQYTSQAPKRVLAGHYTASVGDLGDSDLILRYKNRIPSSTRPTLLVPHYGSHSASYAPTRVDFITGLVCHEFGMSVSRGYERRRLCFSFASSLLVVPSGLHIRRGSFQRGFLPVMNLKGCEQQQFLQDKKILHSLPPPPPPPRPIRKR